MALRGIEFYFIDKSKQKLIWELLGSFVLLNTSSQNMWYLHRAEIIFLRIFLKIICSSPHSGYWSCLLQCTSYGRWTTLLSIMLISKIKNTVLLVTALIFTSWVGKTITFFSDVNALRISRDVYYLYKYWSRERKEAFWSILLWRQDMDCWYSPEFMLQEPDRSPAKCANFSSSKF